MPYRRYDYSARIRKTKQAVLEVEEQIGQIKLKMGNWGDSYSLRAHFKHRLADLERTHDELIAMLESLQLHQERSLQHV